MFKNSKWLWLGLWLVAVTIATVGFVLAVCLNPHLTLSYKLAGSSGIFVGWVAVVAISAGIVNDI